MAPKTAEKKPVVAAKAAKKPVAKKGGKKGSKKGVESWKVRTPRDNSCTAQASLHRGHYCSAVTSRGGFAPWRSKRCSRTVH